MSIPDFLRRENSKPEDEICKKHRELTKKYEEVFGDVPGNEASWKTLEEWIEMMAESIYTAIPIESEIIYDDIDY